MAPRAVTTVADPCLQLSIKVSLQAYNYQSKKFSKGIAEVQANQIRNRFNQFHLPFLFFPFVLLLHQNYPSLNFPAEAEQRTPSRPAVHTCKCAIAVGRRHRHTAAGQEALN